MTELCPFDPLCPRNHYETARRIGFAIGMIEQAIGHAEDVEEPAAYWIIEALEMALAELDGRTTGGKPNEPRADAGTDS